MIIFSLDTPAWDWTDAAAAAWRWTWVLEPGTVPLYRVRAEDVAAAPAEGFGPEPEPAPPPRRVPRELRVLRFSETICGQRGTTARSAKLAQAKREQNITHVVKSTVNVHGRHIDRVRRRGLGDEVKVGGWGVRGKDTAVPESTP